MTMTRDAQFDAALVRATHALGLTVREAQRALMFAYFERLVAANAQFNLTRIIDPVDAAVKLYADSLAPLAWLRGADARVVRVLDVGAGAGFPAVPLAVAMPGWKVTAVDSTGKKVRFVQDCAAALGLNNLKAVHARAGEWRSPQPFQLVLFKAIGPLDRCLQFARGLVARDGFVMAFKGRGLSRAELDAGQVQAESQGMQTWDAFDYTLPLGDETLEHTLVVYRRV
jgi:16S rRNA (guanine527-N7)-methyltransferase